MLMKRDKKEKTSFFQDLFYCRGDRTVTEYDLRNVHIVQFIQGVAIGLLALAHLVTAILSLAGL